MPPTMSYSQSPLFAILIAVLAILVMLLALQIRRLRKGATRKLVATVLVTVVATAGVAGLLAYRFYASYVLENTWTFCYYVNIQADGASVDGIVVPAVTNESLLAGLALDSGIANWSLMNTSHGRGLYIAFTGNATLSVYLSRYPPPSPRPDTSPTMTNGTGAPPEVWIYHLGAGDVSLSFFAGYLGTGVTSVQAGWTVYPLLPPPAVA